MLTSSLYASSKSIGRRPFAKQVLEWRPAAVERGTMCHRPPISSKLNYTIKERRKRCRTLAKFGPVIKEREKFAIIHVMADSRQWYLRTGDGAEYGPADLDSLLTCARDGSVDFSCFLSEDQVNWIPATAFPELELQWVCGTDDGQFAGPFHHDYITAFIQQESAADTVRLYRLDDGTVENELADLSNALEQSRAETVAAASENERLTADLAAAQEETRNLAAQLENARKDAADGQAEIIALKEQLAEAERKIVALQNPQRQRNTLQSLFGRGAKIDSAGLAAIEQAAQRELAALKRPRGLRQIKKARTDVIDIASQPL